ncbi:nucleotide disphospho-sugar-binding domain-containing protein [Streptomyces inhibens]|uniref:nucleotide disphospho-sugar-binding domain-containing protein n=1 Tax=Streptomyces inhibens TaxID=2293571 RepID=UPI001EE6E0A4|nr:nucleotide disphospho-sugar-binding domain-containing protein [Streptomyces inhibens]UKY51781.1 DUF1205 domain-containing protein [Streptomyces inhibens]
MRVLVTAFVPSHFMQMVPTLWALRAADHQVVVAGMPDIVEVARTAGLATAVIGKGAGGFTANVKPGRLGAVKTPEPPRTKGTPTARELAEHRPWETMAGFWRGLVEGSIAEYVEFGRAWQPDLVLCELDFNGLITAGLLGVPSVLHRWGMDLLSPMIQEHARTALADTCARLGLTGGFPLPDLVVDPCPPRLQFGGLPEAVPVRYTPYNGVGSMPDWALKGTDRRRVFVSLGMLGSRSLLEAERRALIGAIALGAAENSDVEFVLPFGTGTRDGLGPLPSSVRLVDPAPLNLFLDTCDLVVHHGGAGTALTACALGVPQLVLPQPHPAHVGCAERLVEHGLGATLAPETLTGEPPALGRAIAGMLGEPSYRKNSEAMAAEMAELPSAHELVARLAELAAR